MEKDFNIKEGFKTPENYFEKSAQSILKKTTKKSVTISLSMKYAVACGLALLLVSALWLRLENPKTEISLAELKSSEIENYLENIINEENARFFIEQMQVIDFEQVSHIEEETIADYLSEFSYELNDVF